MSSAWCSFLEVVTPGQRQSQPEGPGQRPCTCQLVRSQVSESCSRSNSESQRVSADPGTTQRWSEVPINEEHSDSGSEEEFQDSRSSPGDLEEPTPAPGIFPSSSRTKVPQIATTSLGGLISSGEVDVELNTGEGISQEDLIEDAKFYQDVAINYQNAYKALLAQQAELQGKFEAQSHLIQDASAAIDAAETEAKTHHQELLHIS